MQNKEISNVFSNSRQSFSVLKKIPPRQRIEYLKRLKNVLTDDIDSIVNVICEETGKVKAEALFSDIFPSIDALDFYIKNLEEILSPVSVKSSVLFLGYKCGYEFRPSGTALIIGPWNYPFHLAFIPVVSAVAAGCSVVLKPSELAPKTGIEIEKLFKKSGYPNSSVQCIFGGAETVQSAIKNKPSRVLFTGSTQVGREIGKLCGELLIPAVLELGGKAPAVVLSDADLERTAAGIMYGAFVNTGQLCVATTRVIIDKRIKNTFLNLLLIKLEKIAFGKDYGKLLKEDRIPHLQKLVEEAVAGGAKIIYQGQRSKTFEDPVILDNVTPEMKIFREECFAPILCISEFGSEDEAVALANDSDYALEASVWSGSLKKAKKIAAQITAGHICINDVVKGVGITSLPFGGIKDSGTGRYHGRDGIEFFSDKVALMTNKSKSKSEVNWLPYNKDTYKNFKRVLEGKFELKTLKSGLKLLKRRKRDS